MKKLAPGTPKPGNQADPWGSFILLAISEHIRETTGKPEYGEAMTLIRQTRQSSTSSKRRSTQNADSRIRRFKQTNPSWASDLELLKKQFLLFHNPSWFSDLESVEKTILPIE